MSGVRIIARVQVTVEIDMISEQWNETSTMEQVHREGKQMAVERITKLCERYVQLVGVPSVLAITTERK